MIFVVIPFLVVHTPTFPAIAYTTVAKNETSIYWNYYVPLVIAGFTNHALAFKWVN